MSSYKLGRIELANRIVMAPMTRCRAIDNIPNDVIATYYAQRASTGLIITEGTAPSPNGLGYARIPGIYSSQQIEGWKKTTKAVHDQGGKIFVQLMHCGRIAHPLNMPENSVVIAPSAIAAAGQMYTDGKGMLNHPTPKGMTKEDIEAAIQEHVHAAEAAIQAGFDGVELHGANGYLLEQFLNPKSNQRTDEYGGSHQNRMRFVTEVASAVVKKIGSDRVGIRLSPYSVSGDLVSSYDGIDEFYGDLVSECSELGLVYLHLPDHSSVGAPAVPIKTKELLRKNFKGTMISCGGYDAIRAETDLKNGLCDLVAFGRPFIANPDLLNKLNNGLELKTPDHTTFYTPGGNGYTDY